MFFKLKREVDLGLEVYLGGGGESDYLACVRSWVESQLWWRERAKLFNELSEKEILLYWSLYLIFMS